MPAPQHAGPGRVIQERRDLRPAQRQLPRLPSRNTAAGLSPRSSSDSTAETCRRTACRDTPRTDGAPRDDPPSGIVNSDSATGPRTHHLQRVRAEGVQWSGAVEHAQQPAAGRVGDGRRRASPLVVGADQVLGGEQPHRPTRTSASLVALVPMPASDQCPFGELQPVRPPQGVAAASASTSRYRRSPESVKSSLSAGMTCPSRCSGAPPVPRTRCAGAAGCPSELLPRASGATNPPVVGYLRAWDAGDDQFVGVRRACPARAAPPVKVGAFAGLLCYSQAP